MTCRPAPFRTRHPGGCKRPALGRASLKNIVLAPTLLLACALPASAALTEGRRLAAVYDTILDARFEQVDGQLKQICPPAPEGACQVLRLVSLWGQIQINPESRALDPQFTKLATATIAANDDWARREPRRAEAWFYLAASYAPRVQWRILRGERIAAARDGKRIKDALEHALQLDPMLHDAFFGIGLYHYYADVAPAAVKMFRWLLLLPGGDRVRGLREMLQARDRGELLTGEADYQLHLIYLWYEKKTTDALNLLERLDSRYPNNPMFRQRIAEIRDAYLHDRAASAAAWQMLLDRALAGTVNSPRPTEVRARLGLASVLSASNRTSEAIIHLRRIVETRPTEPIGALERAERELRAALARDTPR